MGKYILKRLLALIPVIIGVTFIVFMILDFTPGNPARIILGDHATEEQVAELEERMGLNDNILVQYARYMLGLLKGDLGVSYKNNIPVAVEVFSRFPYTFVLTITSMIFSVVLAIPLGITAATHQNTFIDTFSMIISLIGVSMPMFWLSLLLILLFSLKLGWFPVSGANSLSSIVLPSVALGFMNMGLLARTTRSSMLETIRQDYVRTALSKGIPKKQVTRRHAFRNALIPTITVVGLQMGNLMGGAVLVETVFSWPGMGRLMVQAIQGRDRPMILGCIVIFTISISIINLIVDLLYAVVDPRIRTSFVKG